MRWAAFKLASLPRLKSGASAKDMAPRFVEVPKPLDEAVGIGLKTLAFVGSRLHGFVFDNLSWHGGGGSSTVASTATATIYDNVAPLLQVVPIPKEDTAYLFAMSAAAIAAHMLYVAIRAHVILRAFGSMRRVCKAIST